MHRARGLKFTAPAIPASRPVAGPEPPAVEDGEGERGGAAREDSAGQPAAGIAVGPDTHSTEAAEVETTCLSFPALSRSSLPPERETSKGQRTHKKHPRVTSLPGFQPVSQSTAPLTGQWLANPGGSGAPRIPVRNLEAGILFHPYL